MSILVSAQSISKSFAARTLFEEISFSVESGDRIGLIGPNGAGKSTLLRILAGQMPPDSGTLSKQKSLKVGFLEQVPKISSQLTVLECLLEAAHDPHDWQEMSRAHELIAKLELTEDSTIGALSGGWRKRVALARELMRTPDLLLLDEPTNHLDVESIAWLENLIEDSPFAYVTITHDRVFLQNVSTRILELDRRNAKGLLDIRGSYSDYLATKADLMSAQESQEIKLKNTLRRETEWLRQGAKARTTKQSARIERAGELKSQVEDLEDRNQARKVRLDFQDAGHAPKKLIEAVAISKSWDGRATLPLIEELLITPKTRMGLLGPNGCGKSTLLKILQKQLEPDKGSVKHADGLKIAFFEQNRESLDPSKSVLRSVCPMGEYVDFGSGKVHVSGFLKRFLFGPDMHDQPVSKLSGGEQARLLIAKLMLQPAHILILDEPTNDLDIQTLQVLEEVLQDFTGAVILVSHDRYFLDNVSTELLAFSKAPDQSPQITRFASLGQWQKWSDSRSSGVSVAVKNSPSPTPKSQNSRKRSYKEQFELDNMESKIQEAEQRVAQLSELCSSPGVLADSNKLRETTAELSKAQAEVERLYARWEELERE